MEKKSSYSTRLFREFKSLSIMIEETDEEYGFKYNGSHYNLHIVDDIGAFFIYRKMVVSLVYNIHDNVLHHCCDIPMNAFNLALGRHKKTKNIRGIWGDNGSFVYTDLIFLDSKLPFEKTVSESLAQLEGVYNTMRDDITDYIMF